MGLTIFLSMTARVASENEMIFAMSLTVFYYFMGGRFMVDKQDFDMIKEELEELIKRFPEILKELKMVIVFDK